MKNLKKLVSTVKSAVQRVVRRVTVSVRRTDAAILAQRQAVRLKLAETSGQFSVDTGVVIVITVAVAAIVLALVIGFLQSDLAPAVKEKILGFLN